MSYKRTLDKAIKTLDEYRTRITGSNLDDIVNKAKNIVQSKLGVSDLKGKYTKDPTVDVYTFSRRGKSVASIMFSHENFHTPDYKNDGGMLIVY